MDTNTIAAGLGALVGLVLGLTGAGGGILAVPLLLFGLHLPMAQAVPVGLIAVGLAAALGAVLGLRDGLVRYRAAALVGMAGMVLAPVGVWLGHVVPNDPLVLAFAAVLTYVALRMLKNPANAPAARDPSKAPVCARDPRSGRFVWTLPCSRMLAATGMVSGLLSGLLGVGGGFVIVPSLTQFSDLDTRSILATSLAVIALVSVGGVGAAAVRGAVDWAVALPFSGGAVLALLAGRRVSARLDAVRLRQAFSLASLSVAVLLACKVFGWLPQNS